MAAGYKMVEAKSDDFERGALGSASRQEFDWDFLRLVPPMKDRRNKGHEDLKRLLRVGASLSGKIWRLEPIRCLLLLLLVLVAAVGVVWSVESIFPGLWAKIGSLWPWGLGGAAILAVNKTISNKRTLGRFFLRHALSSTVSSLLLVLLWPVAWIHLWVFDRRYLARGRVY